MSQRVSVGDPAVASLSSSICVFPGGFSLLTETGRLRPYFVSDTAPEDDVTAAAVAVPEVIAADPIHLSAPSPQGLFPVDQDVPVDHSWSRDGSILVVLRRSSFSVYQCCRPLQSSGSNDENGDIGSKLQDGPARPRSIGPYLGLEEVYTSCTDFGGKVVACCSIDVPTAAAAETAAEESASKSRGSGTDDRPAYLIAIGGTFGIECHAVKVFAPPRRNADTTTAPTTANDKQPEVQQPKRVPLPGKGEPLLGYQALAAGAQENRSATMGAAAATATCRPLTTLFRGYPVVALACSPNSSLMAAAAMTGHVRIWHVASIAAPVQQQQEVVAPSRREPVKRGRGDKKKGLDGVLSATRPLRQLDSVGAAALWGVTLPMARATSLSFSPTDSATFALACWDGAVVVFTPTSTATAATSTPPFPDGISPSLIETLPDRRGSGDNTSRIDSRAWKPVWREKPAPVKAGGGKGGSLEDQDGAFLCWCRRPGSNAVADLAVSAYGVTANACSGSEHRDHAPPGLQGVTGSGDGLHGSDGCAQKGPGFELFAAGFGERLGGMLAGSRPSGVTEHTAERYLIHGLAAGPKFVALYDSDLCLHVVSLAAILSVGSVLPPPSCRNPAAEAVARESVQEAPHLTGDATQTQSDAAATEDGPPPTAKVMLVSNDHGLAVADVVRHREPGGHGFDGSCLAEGGLKLSVTWRNPTTGEETADDGKCAGKAGGSDTRMPFLPAQLASDAVDDELCGVFCADVRWGRLALFTRYTVLVYTRLSQEIEAAGKAPEAEAESLSAPSLAGGWRAYAGYPIVHGVLLGGASTAAPRSRHLPNAPPDMDGLHLVTVLATDGDGPGPVVTVRSLRDRTLTCRRALNTTASDGKEAGVAANRVKVYASPGYAGSGVFVVAAGGGEGECAIIWRAAFDEATFELKLAPPRVITSSPWPEPETLRLAGVAGPNCELILFKEVSDSRTDGSAGDQNVRWWITWPELDIWKYVEAPVLLGDEELGVADFVKIFQLEVEEMMVSRPAAGTTDPLHGGRTSNDIGGCKA